LLLCFSIDGNDSLVDKTMKRKLSRRKNGIGKINTLALIYFHYGKSNSLGWFKLLLLVNSFGTERSTSSWRSMDVAITGTNFVDKIGTSDTVKMEAGDKERNDWDFKFVKKMNRRRRHETFNG
jgi:hypothetical protein